MTLDKIADLKKGHSMLVYDGRVYEYAANEPGTLLFQNLNDDSYIRVPETTLYTDKSGVYRAVPRKRKPY